MIGGHRWQKIRGNSRLVVRLASKSLTVPVPKEHHDVEYRHSRVADIILQIGWETNISHTECEQLDLAVNICCRLYWAYMRLLDIT